MRFILLLLMVSALTFGLGCRNASSSSTETKSENPVLEKSAEKAATTEDQAEHTEDDDAPRINLADAKKDFDEGNSVFVDTRSTVAYQAEHVKGAINVPAGEFEKFYKEIPKDKKIIAYCS